MKSIKLFTISTLLSFGFVECTKTEANPTEFYGESISLGSGTVKSFYRIDDAGNPEEIGIAISEAALNGLPHTSTENVIPLPAEAQVKTPFKFVLLNYNHQGHEPAHVYDLPHFDVHYYMTSNEDRLKINSSDKGVEAPPADGYLPMPSVPTGVISQMGNHWIDVTSPELNGGKFTNTFIYGTAYGKVIFYEPMITPEYIKASVHNHSAIKQPQKYDRTGYLPSEYCVKYNATAKQYEVTLETFLMK